MTKTIGDAWDDAYDHDEYYYSDQQRALEALEDVDNMPDECFDDEDDEDYEYLEDEYGEALFVPMPKRNHEEEHEETKQQKRDRQARNIARRAKEFIDRSKDEDTDE